MRNIFKRNRQEQLDPSRETGKLQDDREAAQAELGGSSGPEESTGTAEDEANSAGAVAQPDTKTRPPFYGDGPFDGRYPLSRILINHDNHGEGRGEDADPLWRVGLLGVFDGLGGAGGELIKVGDGTEQTGAWMASREVRRLVRDAFDQNSKRSAPRAPHDVDIYGDVVTRSDQEFDFTVEIREVIQHRLDAYAHRIREMGGGSRVKSKLIKMLPTTLAVCTYDLDKNKYTAIWAGDSRVFYLRPQEGLLQVTTDDLRTNADAMQNLTEDSPMSNCVSADSEFVLHERQSDLQPFSVLLAATDGCFGYVQTPLHFEHLLLSSMQEAADWQDWARRLLACILQVTGDDATLSAAVIGWRDFRECQERFQARAGWCADRVRTYDEIHGRVQRLHRELDQARKELSRTKSTLWEEYRSTYEMRAESPTRHVTGRQQGMRGELGQPGADHSSGADRT